MRVDIGSSPPSPAFYRELLPRKISWGSEGAFASLNANCELCIRVEVVKAGLNEQASLSSSKNGMFKFAIISRVLFIIIPCVLEIDS